MATSCLGSLPQPGLLDFVGDRDHLGTINYLVGLKQGAVVCCAMPVLRRLRQETLECEASMGATVNQVHRKEEEGEEEETEEEEEGKGDEGGKKRA